MSGCFRDCGEAARKLYEKLTARSLYQSQHSFRRLHFFQHLLVHASLSLSYMSLLFGDQILASTEAGEPREALLTIGSYRLDEGLRTLDSGVHGYDPASAIVSSAS